MTSSDPASGPAAHTKTPQTPGAISPFCLARWLYIVAGLVILIIAVGGITRLTESGLSITHWKPVTGLLPPLSDAQWEAEFAAYRQIGEYQQIKGPAGMSMADYRFIYYWEWVHRILARIIGLAFALPLIWFWIRGQIPSGYKPRLLVLLALGALQGVFGWFMVRSGLSTEVTSVSHFWLSIHFLTALLTLGGLIWVALDLQALGKDPATPHARLTSWSVFAALTLTLQIVLGAWVAGLNAGLASDSWPLMQGRLLPEISWDQGFWWTLTHDPFLLHFLHRWWAWVVVAIMVVFARKIRKAGCRPASIAIHSAFGTQIILGIITVLTRVDLWIAVLHQLVGAILVATTVWGMHVLGRTSGQKS